MQPRYPRQRNPVIDNAPNGCIQQSATNRLHRLLGVLSNPPQGRKRYPGQGPSIDWRQTHQNAAEQHTAKWQ